MAGRGKPKKLNSEALWEYALRLLGARPYSSSELRRKLALRAESAADVPDTMAKLREYGFADDRKFSENVASSRLANQGFGRFRVLRELQSKQVARSIAEAAVEKTFSGTDETALAQRFLARKYRGKDLRQLLKEPKHLAGAYRKLRIAGFSSSVSVSVLKQHANPGNIPEEPESEE